MRVSLARGAVRAGFAALAQWQLAALLLGVTLAPGLLAASTLWPALHAGFAQTLAGDHVLRNDPLLAPTDVIDFFFKQAPAISGTWHAAWAAAFFGVLVQIFFAGGFVRSLGRPIRPTVADFLEGSRRDFGHNFKCFLLFGVAAALAIGVWLAAAFGARRRLLEGLEPGHPAFLATTAVTVVVAGLLYAFLSLWHDYARAARRIDPGIGAWRGYGFARRRLSGRWPTAIGLFLIWAVVGGVALLLLFALGWSFPAVSAAGVVILFMIQVATLCVRPLVRVATWGSYIALLDRASAPPEPSSTPAPLPSPPGFAAPPRPVPGEPAPPPARPSPDERVTSSTERAVCR